MIAYGGFLLSAGWAIGFLAGRGAPTSIDGTATSPAWMALLIDAALLLVFAVQHSVMARAGVKRHLRRLGYRPPDFTQRWLYAWCRHPMMLGLLIAFWGTPHMTLGHLFFAAAATAYIAVGIRFEERDLRAQFGAGYPEYASRVPALLPVPRSLRAPGAGSSGPAPR